MRNNIILTLVISAAAIAGSSRCGESTVADGKFLVLEYMQPEVEATFAKYKAQKAYTLYQGGVDAKADGNFSPEALAAWPMEGHPTIPADYAGIIVIDWEDKMMNRLMEKDSKAIDEYLKAIQAIRKRWPKAKLTAYGIPLFQYWAPPKFDRVSKVEDWMELAKFTAPLTSALDLLCEPLYDSYPGNDESDNIYFAGRVKLCKQIHPDKKMAALIWGRYHEGSSAKPLGQIPVAEVKSTIKVALENGADYIIQWGAETDWINYGRAFSKIDPKDPNYSLYKGAHDNVVIPEGWAVDKYKIWSQQRIVAIISSVLNGTECEFGDKP